MDKPLMSQVQAGNVPLVTVAMPIFNAGSYLRLAVLSIVRQTFADWEMLIIDDGSTDNALQDIADIRDYRIRILRDGENKGLAARLNEAIDLARGRYFARMDQDDVSYPERFARQIEALERDPQLDLVAARAVTIDGDHRLTGLLPASAQKKISIKPWRGFYMPHPTWMGRIGWFRKYRYTEPGPYFCEDQELLLRSHEESRFGIIEQPLLAYRIREKSSWRKLIKTRLTILPVQLRHFLTKEQLFFALMAILTFIGRFVLDVLRPILGIKYPIARIPGEETFQKWRNVLNNIQEGGLQSHRHILEEQGHIMEAQNNLSLYLLWPIKWRAFGIASLVNVFPVLTIFYLIIWNSESMSWITRGVFFILMALSIRGLNYTNVLRENARIYDFMIAVFFCFAIIGYVRSDYPGLVFQYFLFLNLFAFFLGRFSNGDEYYSLFAYLFTFGLCVSLVFLYSLPEIYHQWKYVGPKHPVLFGFITTACGIDVTLGCFMVLAGSAIYLNYFKQIQYVKWLMHACVALSLFLLILIGSKSVIIAVILSLITIIAIQYKRWSKGLSLLVTLIISSVIALTLAPENNIRYYDLVSPSSWFEYYGFYTSNLKTADTGVIAGLIPKTADTGVIAGLIPKTADTGVIRLHLTLDAIQKIMDRPWLGMGAKSWTYNSPHPHNIFLESALMFGILSSFALMIFYLTVIWRLLIWSVDKKQDVLIGVLLLFFILYNLIQGQLASFRSLPLFLLSGYAVSMIARQREFVTFGKKNIIDSP